MIPRSESDLWQGVERAVGSSRADSIRSGVRRRSAGKQGDKIYDLVFADLGCARASTMLVAPMAQAWLRHIERLDLPDGDLLDLGCGFGLFTCFYALLRPNHEVVGIDASRLGIETATALANDLQLRNVTFQHCDPRSADLRRRFSTVVSSAVLSELGEIPAEAGTFSTATAARERFSSGSSRLAQTAARHLTDDGTYLSYERLAGIEEYAYWIGALARCGLNVSPSTIVPLSWSSAVYGHETMPVMRADRVTAPPIIEALFEWKTRTKTVVGNDDFVVERSLATSRDLRFLHGVHFDIRDAHGRGATRVYALSAEGRAHVYMTTSRGARLIQRTGPVSKAATLVDEIRQLELQLRASSECVGVRLLT